MRVAGGEELLVNSRDKMEGELCLNAERLSSDLEERVTEIFDLWISPEWARILFPPEKREYELVYHGKKREEDLIANTLAVPLQKVRTFGKKGDDWHNMLIFGDNLQVMKHLQDLKRVQNLRNAPRGRAPAPPHPEPGAAAS